MAPRRFQVRDVRQSSLEPPRPQPELRWVRPDAATRFAETPVSRVSTSAVARQVT
jgi:hypothetical protein